MPAPFFIVSRIVLGGRDRLEVFGIVSLQAFHKSHAQARDQIRILAVAFLRPTPTGIARHVNHRAPKGESHVRQAGMKTGAGFIRNAGADLEEQIRIPGGGHGNALWENRGHADVGRNAVHALVAPIISRNPQPVDGRGFVHHLGNFLCQAHATDQVADALFDGLAGIEVEGFLLLGLGYNNGGVIDEQ